MVTDVCVCGAGTMGCGIAQVTATAGFHTILYDVHEEVLQKAKMKLEADLQKLADKQKITLPEKEAILQRIVFSADSDRCRAGMIIEAIIETMEAKVSLFRQLAAINPATTLLASNTSSLCLTEIADQVPHPERVTGLHFFNPAPLMKLVEVVTTRHTPPETVQMVVALARRLGKIPVVCKDAPGFIVNRVARPYYIESLRLAEENSAGFEVIDQLLEDRGFKMGPFKLMDLIGNDVNYAVSCSVYQQLNGPERLRPSYLQKEKVENNELGKKTGKGFYDYL